jgi:hypothetical protein
LKKFIDVHKTPYLLSWCNVERLQVEQYFFNAKRVSAMPLPLLDVW